MEYFVFQIVPTDSVFFTFFHQIFIHTDKTPPSILFLKVNSCSSRSLSFHVRCSSPFNKPHGSSLDFLQYVHFLPILGRPGLDKALQVQTPRAKQRKRIPSLYLLARLCLGHSRIGLSGRLRQTNLYIPMPPSETLYPTIKH